MHIENFHVHVGPPADYANAIKQTIEYLDGQQGQSHQGYFGPNGWAGGMLRELLAKNITAPKIGAAWPGIEGIYAGISRGEDGEPDAHLVLLNAKPDADMKWAEAVQWGGGLGGGARLPTRFEAALLYANLKDLFDTDRYYWTGSQYSSLTAWAQYFGYGYQDYLFKTSDDCRARAVRRLIL